MKKIIYKIALFILISLSTLSIKAQTLTLTAGTICFDTIINLVISVPISVQHMNSVYSFSLYLNYNKNFLTYTGYNVDNPSLVNTSVVNNSNSGQVFITYSPDTVPINIQNDTIYHINFTLNSAASTILQWSYVRFWGLNADSIPSIQVNGATLSAPVFIQQPFNQSVSACLDTAVNFFVQTLDSSQTYQWQVSQNNGTTWSNLINDNHYQNVTTSLLTIYTPQVQMNNFLFRCMLVGPCTVFSGEALLNVISNVLTQPRDTLINIGGTAVFKTQATGNSPSYLWEESIDGGATWSSSALFPPVTTSNITIIGAPASWNGYKFRCIVNGECSPPADTTHIATLWVGASGIYEHDGIVLKIYPNPVQDFLHITIENANSTYSFLLYDITGRQVIQMNDLITNTYTINLQNLRAGMYFYRLINAKSGVEASGKVILNTNSK